MLYSSLKELQIEGWLGNELANVELWMLQSIIVFISPAKIYIYNLFIFLISNL